ncbi:unnamed protein product, partial [marine sediment metagenome]
ATCVVAAFSLVVPAIVFACGSAVLSTVAMFTPNDTDNLILSNIGVIQCAFAFKPWEIVACAGSIMSFIDTIIEIINQDNDENENQPPIISDLSADPPSVNINQTTTITCFASDPDGDPLTYTWTKTGGTITGSGSAITWTAPSTDGSYTVECEVSDGEASDSEQVVITVKKYNEGDSLDIYDLQDSVNSGTPYTVRWYPSDDPNHIYYVVLESTEYNQPFLVNPTYYYEIYDTSKVFTHSVHEDTTYYYK